MALLIQDRIGNVGLVVIAREQNGGAQIDRASPEARQNLALDLESLHESCVRGNLNGRDYLVADDADSIALGRVERQFLRRAVQISGRAIPALALPAIVVHPDNVAVGTMELGVNVDERLNIIFAGRDFREADHWRS